MKLNEMKGGGDYLEPGTHEVYFHTLEMKETSKSYTKYINVLFKDDNGGAHFEKFFISLKSLWKIRDLCFACGIDENYDIDIVPDESINLEFLLGKRLVIEIKKESYPDSNGGIAYSNVIKSFSPCVINTGNDETFQTSVDVSGGDPF